MVSWHRWRWVGLVLALGLRPAPAQLSGEQAEGLGLDPARPPVWQTIYTRPATAPAPADPRRTVAGVELTNVAGNRYVWRVTFLADYDPHSVLHLYLDTDNDPKTGRQDGNGTEVMLTQQDGAAHSTLFTPDGKGDAGPGPRLLITGATVYQSADLDLKQVDGRARFRMMVLSERLDPHVAVDNVRWFTVDGPGLGAGPKPRLEGDLAATEGFLRYRGLPTILALQRNPANHAVSIRGAAMQGFVEDTVTEYRGISAYRKGGPGSTLTYTVPVAGRYHLGVQLYDGDGDERARVELNGRKLGYLVATDECRDLVLFSTPEPVALQAGDKVTIKTLTGSGMYRLEELLLLAQPAPVWKPVYAVRYAQADDVSHDPFTAEHGTARVTFLTTWPVAATIEYGDSPALGRQVAEPDPVINHRVWLPSALSAEWRAPRFCRITAQAPDGRTVRSEVLPVGAPTPPAGVSPARRTELRLLNAEVLPPAGWPVSSGVPLPKGVLGDAANVRLTAGGREVPLHTRRLASWEDGSVKWVWLDLVAKPEHGGRYVLEYGAGVSHTEPTEGVAPEVERAARSLPSTLVTADGTTGTAAEPERRRVLQYGGFTRLVRADGHYRDAQGKSLGAYETELHYVPGLPMVKVYLTYVNDRTDAAWTNLRSLSLHLPLKGSATIQGDQSIDAAPGTALRQVEDNRYELTRDGKAAGEGKRAAGYVTLKQGDSTVGVIPREFWQNWPKGLRVGADGIDLDVLPDIRDVPYGTDFFDLKKPDHRLYYLFDHGSYKLKLGCSRRTEFWLTFGLDPAAAAKAVASPPFLAATPEWYQQTRAFGDLSIATQTAYPQYEQAVVKGFDGLLKGREANREYGFLNFGDWYGERGTNWGNIEYDTQHACFLQFARTAEPRWLLAGEQAERHNTDVDTVWAGPNRGKAYAHCLGHVGDYLDQPVGPSGSQHGGFTASHTWCEGHAEWYYLTGDLRSREVAELIATTYGHKTETPYDYANGRDSGWHLIFTTAVYELTRDPYYLNAARVIVDRVAERQTPNGGWDRMLVPGHCLHDPPRHRGEAGFMLGVLLTGLKDYHQLTGDPRVPDMMYRASKYLIADMWVPSAKGFRYTSCPTSTVGPWSNMLLFEGMAYADRFHPDEAVHRIFREGCVSGLANVDDFGKSFTQNTRDTPHVLWDMERLDREDAARGVPVASAGPDQVLGLGAGDTVTLDASASHDRGAGKLVAWHWEFGDGSTGEGAKVQHVYAKEGVYTASLTVRDNDRHTAGSTTRVSVAPLWVRRLDPKSLLKVEAETFSGQGEGAVQVIQRVGSSGTMVTKWHQNAGHWLEWKVAVPKEGDYRLALRYCTDMNAHRKLELDGQTPRADLAALAFPATGGFSTGADNWRYLLVGGEAAPWTVHLTAGEHVLRLTNPGGEGLGLDWLVLIPVK